MINSSKSHRAAAVRSNRTTARSLAPLVTLLGGTVLLCGATVAVGQQFQQETTTRFPTQSEYTNQCTVVDIDGDGALDIVWANGQGYTSQGAALKPRIYMNNGSGFFTDATDARAPGITGWFRGVEAGDMDDDGDMDLILTQDFNKRPLLLVNDGSGVFTDGTVARLPNITMSSARAQFGDVDNDGDLDLVFCNSGTVSRFGTNGRPQIFLNNGAGFYTDATATNFPGGNLAEQMDIFFLDVDNDLDLDVFVTSRSSASRLWKNDGTGVYTNQTGVPVTGTGAYSFDAADIDGDGDLDLVGIGIGTDRLLRNNGGGSSWAVISSNLSPNGNIDDNDSRFFDIDNDGDLDLIVGSLGSSERVYVNNGTGLFTQTAGIFPAVSDPTLDIKVADFNNDGRYDVITAQGEGSPMQNRIFMNVTGSVDTRPPTIPQVTKIIPGTEPAPHVVRANIYDAHTSDRGFFDRGVYLRWTVNGGAVQEVPMRWAGGNQWRGVIPACPPASLVEYWISATDWAHNTGTSAASIFIEGGTAANPADLNGDGTVNGADLGLLLASWGDCTDCPADLNGDGTVNGADLGLLLASWG